MCKVVPKDSGLRKNSIQYHCEDVCILNESDKKLIIANDVSYLSIISTDDVLHMLQQMMLWKTLRILCPILRRTISKLL